MPRKPKQKAAPQKVNGDTKTSSPPAPTVEKKALTANEREEIQRAQDRVSQLSANLANLVDAYEEQKRALVIALRDAKKSLNEKGEFLARAHGINLGAEKWELNTATGEYTRTA